MPLDALFQISRVADIQFIISTHKDVNVIHGFSITKKTRGKVMQCGALRQLYCMAPMK